jgi:8-oxo-dGTP pyrophosphatase MutT (NUDIX family)
MLKDQDSELIPEVHLDVDKLRHIEWIHDNSDYAPKENAPFGAVERSLNCYVAMSGEPAIADSVREALGRRGDEFFRKVPGDHMTASAMIVNHNRQMLLTLHRKYRTWQQLGGHAKSERDPVYTALREAYEESGLNSISLFPSPIDIDIHNVLCPNGFSSRHFDICYMAVADGNLTCRASDESLRIEWVTFADAAKRGAAERVINMGRTSFALLDLLCGDG